MSTKKYYTRAGEEVKMGDVSSKEALIALELLKEFQNILEHEYPDPK